MHDAAAAPLVRIFHKQELLHVSIHSKTNTGPYSYSCTWITQNQGDCWPVAMHTEQPHTIHRLLTWHTVADSWVGQHGLQDTISSRLNDVDPG